MSSAPILPIIFMLLPLGALVWGLYRGPAVLRSSGEKSKLARDGGLGGVGFLIPVAERPEVAALRAGNKKT